MGDNDLKWISLANIWVICLLLLPSIHRSEASDIPNCDYEDTVDLTDSQKFANGSYLFEGVMIPAELTGAYDYQILYKGRREAVKEHKRGCACKLKPCVKFCCHPYERNSSGVCSRELLKELQYSPYVNITFASGSRSVHVLDEFVVQQGHPCSNDINYMLDPASDVDDSWELFENGTLLRMYDKKFMSRQDYCLASHESNGTYMLNPLNCADLVESPQNLKLNNIAMLISIPFLLVTAFVYGFIPELRTLHGKCLICYLLCLSIGYAVIVVITLSAAHFEFGICSFLGFTGYYFFMSAFFWLSVISFDLWHNFRGTTCNVQRYTQNKRFCVYSLYAWGFPVILTILTILAQWSNFDDSLKPGIGIEYCWIKTDDWSAMIYFYGPNLLLILFNVTMFVLTSLKIYEVKRDLERMMDAKDGTRRLGSEKDNFGLFLRLFIIMGVTWLLEVGSYLVGSWNVWSPIFYLPDLCNAAQGIIIFILFVLKRKVKKLVVKRILCREKTSSSHSNSTQSDSKEEEIFLQDCAKDGTLQFVD